MGLDTKTLERMPRMGAESITEHIGALHMTRLNLSRLHNLVCAIQADVVVGEISNLEVLSGMCVELIEEMTLQLDAQAVLAGSNIQ